MANPNPIQTDAFIAQHTGELGAQRKTFGVRFPKAIEAQLLDQEDAYAFIRQAVREKLGGASKPDGLAVGSCWKLPGQQPIEIRSIVDNQAVCRFKGTTGWQYAIEPVARLEKAIEQGKAKPISKL